jgi:hypothetical protein
VDSYRLHKDTIGRSCYRLAMLKANLEAYDRWDLIDLLVMFTVAVTCYYIGDTLNPCSSIEHHFPVYHI